MESNDSETYASLKRRINRVLKESGAWSRYKQQGRAALSESGKAAFDKINTFCKGHGSFIVPAGELESWLVPFGLERSSNKSVWIVKALQKLSDMETLPSDSELARFVRDIHDYLLSQELNKYFP